MFVQLFSKMKKSKHLILGSAKGLSFAICFHFINPVKKKFGKFLRLESSSQNTKLTNATSKMSKVKHYYFEYILFSCLLFTPLIQFMLNLQVVLMSLKYRRRKIKKDWLSLLLTQRL